MEWFMPLILCVGYVAVCKGYEDLWVILKGVAVVALIELYCGQYGISRYLSLDEKISFGDKKFYVHNMDPKLITSLLWYFVCYVVCVILLLQIIYYTSQSNRWLNVQGNLDYFYILQGSSNSLDTEQQFMAKEKRFTDEHLAVMDKYYTLQEMEPSGSYIYDWYDFVYSARD